MTTAFLAIGEECTREIAPHHTHTTRVRQPPKGPDGLDGRPGQGTFWKGEHRSLIQDCLSHSLQALRSQRCRLQQGRCTSFPDATAPRSNSVALNTKMACLPPACMHLTSQKVPAPVFLALCCRLLLLMRTPLVLVPPVQPKAKGPRRLNSTQQSRAEQTGPPTAGNLSEANMSSFAGVVVERHLMSRLSSIIKSASDRGDQDSLRIAPIVNGNMGPPGQSQRTCPSTVWEEGARAEI